MGNTRKLKVYSGSIGNNRVPQIILQGKWLEQYGFNEGNFIAVECENGKLIITPRQPDPEENFRSLAERVDGMTKAQKQKVAQLLDEMGVE